ncbi:hypothetical protein JTE90_003229 [Oedothorax gibbosus]|uniref:Transmembrane protein 59 n=1 Tax=Oedothorax gibbosus TaxID=931172 RepID=A0AAV6UQ39_9ARAC|nr:hypothetical protein JTE90_003229 [Oedothorax gibbosus]
MFRTHLCLFSILCLFFIKSISCAALEHFLRGVPVCESQCERKVPDASTSLQKACSEGCRLFPVIGLAKDERDSNKTVKLCESACSEAFTNGTFASACNLGCRAYPSYRGHENDVKTLHLLLPLAYVRSAYNSMAHHVKQFISTSWTVYLNEDSGKMVVVQSSPKVMESVEYSVSNNDLSLKDYQQPGVWQEGVRVGWMECLSHQSGIPRWLLVVVLMGFIVALMWLCLATAVTAPNQYINASKKKDMGYILICEPNNELKSSLLPVPEETEEAPPLPPKISLI